MSKQFLIKNSLGENVEFTKIKNFKINRRLVGKGIVFAVESQGFYYDHDEAWELAAQSDESDDRVHNVNRSEKYTMTKGFPGFAELAVIKYE